MLALEPRYPAGLAQRFENARFDRAHNLLLDQLLTTGVVGTGALLAVLWVVVRGGLSPCRRQPRTGAAVVA